MSAAETASRRKRAVVIRDDAGNALIGFAFILPLLLALCFGIVDFSLVLLDFHRASEATRRGARSALIADPIASLAALPAGGTVLCRGGAGVTCTGGALVNADGFDTVLAEMRGIMPGVGPENLEVEYRWSGIGDPASPGGILPLVTVRVRGLRHDLVMLRAIPGLPSSVTLPDFMTMQVGSGIRP